MPEGLQGRSAFNVAVKLTARLCKQRIIASASDEIAVVFYGTGKAQNSRNWEGVYVLHDLDVPDAQRIQDLQDMSGRLQNSHSMSRTVFIHVSLHV